METGDVLALGLGLESPWKLSGQRLDIEKQPHELHLEVIADRGALFPCPDCKRACRAHDFESFTGRLPISGLTMARNLSRLQFKNGWPRSA